MGKGTRTSSRLTTVAVARANVPGLYADGDRLYLRVSSTGTKGWIFRYALNGRKRDAGLGPFPSISLRRAREIAIEFRQLLARDIDPVSHRANERIRIRQAALQKRTFDECARQYIDVHEVGWSNPVHRRQWRRTLEIYASPVIGNLPIGDVDTEHVLGILEPIWHTMPETASRLRGRLEAILDWSKVRGFRDGDNPARWRGHIATLLPAKSRVRAVQHHPAMPFVKVPAFMARLAAESCISSRALRVLLHTAARTGEILFAEWTEVDLDKRLWTVPAARMKARREHRVPLSDPASEILRELAAVRSSEFIFPGLRAGQPLSNMAMTALMRRLDVGRYTVHGFRSSFRDWAAEVAEAPRELAEMSLAHTVGNAVEAAYRRGDLLQRRRRLMDDWSAYCCGGACKSRQSRV